MTARRPNFASGWPPPAKDRSPAFSLDFKIRIWNPKQIQKSNVICSKLLAPAGFEFSFSLIRNRFGFEVSDFNWSAKNGKDMLKEDNSEGPDKDFA
jgi:hypothetical protein